MTALMFEDETVAVLDEEGWASNDVSLACLLDALVALNVPLIAWTPAAEEYYVNKVARKLGPEWSARPIASA